MNVFCSECTHLLCSTRDFLISVPVNRGEWILSILHFASFILSTLISFSRVPHPYKVEDTTTSLCTIWERKRQKCSLIISSNVLIHHCIHSYFHWLFIQCGMHSAVFLMQRYSFIKLASLEHISDDGCRKWLLSAQEIFQHRVSDELARCKQTLFAHHLQLCTDVQPREMTFTNVFSCINEVVLRKDSLNIKCAYLKKLLVDYFWKVG